MSTLAYRAEHPDYPAVYVRATTQAQARYAAAMHVRAPQAFETFRVTRAPWMDRTLEAVNPGVCVPAETQR